MFARYLLQHLSRNLSHTRELSAKKIDYISPSAKTFKFRPPPYDEVTILYGEGAKVCAQIGAKSEPVELIDCMSQNLCISVGYRVPEIEHAVRSQQMAINHTTTMFDSPAHHSAAETLVKSIQNGGRPGSFGDMLSASFSRALKEHGYVVHFTTTGSEAVDLALQMADVYCDRVDDGCIASDPYYRKPKWINVALTNAYHGVQGYASSATHVPSMHSFPRLYTPHIHIEPNAQALNSLLPRGNRVQSIIVEPIQGYGGVIPLTQGFMSYAFSCVKNQGGVTIVDEIQTGFGRTGKKFWAFQDHISEKEVKLYPDMILFAKGAGNGYIIAGVIVKRHIAEKFCEKKTFNTFAASPVSCVALDATVNHIYSEGLMQKVNVLGRMFKNYSLGLCHRYPSVYKDIRGEGFLQGLEVNGDLDFAVKVQSRLLDNGVLMGRGGTKGSVLRFQPPMCLTVDELLHIHNSLDEVGSFLRRK